MWYSSCPAWCFWCWHARCSDIPHVCHVCCRRRRCVGCALFSPLTPPGERTQGHILLCFSWTTQISLTPSQSISSASHPPLLPLSITSNPVRLEDFERSLAAGRKLTVCLLCHVRWDDLIFLVQSGWVLVRPASFWPALLSWHNAPVMQRKAASIQCAAWRGHQKPPAPRGKGNVSLPSPSPPSRVCTTNTSGEG